MGESMGTSYVVHIVAGSVGLLSGFIALYTAKGAPLHRQAGLVFVCSMVTMAVAGGLIAAVRNTAPAINIPVALLTLYLVVTAFTTVHPPRIGGRWMHATGMVLALGVGLIDARFGLDALASASVRERGMAFPFLMFAVVALLGFAGDARVLRAGALRGAPRIARHLWRMTFALFIAALSFFIGQAGVIPKPLRIMPLLAVPVLAVLVTMFYWLWRVRIRQSLRGLVRANVGEAARLPSAAHGLAIGP
jgi:uncharacterized membrane protein